MQKITPSCPSSKFLWLSCPVNRSQNLDAFKSSHAFEHNILVNVPLKKRKDSSCTQEDAAPSEFPQVVFLQVQPVLGPILLGPVLRHFLHLHFCTVLIWQTDRHTQSNMLHIEKDWLYLVYECVSYKHRERARVATNVASILLLTTPLRENVYVEAVCACAKIEARWQSIWVYLWTIFVQSICLVNYTPTHTRLDTFKQRAYPSTRQCMFTNMHVKPINTQISAGESHRGVLRSLAWSIDTAMWFGKRCHQTSIPAVSPVLRLRWSRE